jgi:CheY-like chemotaxis protein
MSSRSGWSLSGASGGLMAVPVAEQDLSDFRCRRCERGHTIPQSGGGTQVACAAAVTTERRMDRTIVLVVDDDPAVLDLLSRALAEQGLAVSVARRVSVARDILARQPVGLVIADARIPGESGICLAAHVRDCGIPVILMTGDPDWIGRQGALPAPCLLKPFDLRTLWRVVATRLAAARASAGAFSMSDGTDPLPRS